MQDFIVFFNTHASCSSFVEKTLFLWTEWIRHFRRLTLSHLHSTTTNTFTTTTYNTAASATPPSSVSYVTCSGRTVKTVEGYLHLINLLIFLNQLSYLNYTFKQSFLMFVLHSWLHVLYFHTLCLHAWNIFAVFHVCTHYFISFVTFRALHTLLIHNLQFFLLIDRSGSEENCRYDVTETDLVFVPFAVLRKPRDSTSVTSLVKRSRMF